MLRQGNIFTRPWPFLPGEGVMVLLRRPPGHAWSSVPAGLT